MILARASAVCLTVALASAATVARADVMEVTADGARWVAGGTTPGSQNVVLLSAGQPSAPLSEEEQAALDGMMIADGVVSDLDEHGSEIPPAYRAKIAELAARYDLSPSLLEAVVWQESRWRANAISPAGARGLSQLMPGTARYLGVDPDDPMQNLEGGARYLREQLDRFDGDLELALAAYNAGPGRVIRAGGVPNIRETRQYVAAIMGRLADQSRAEAE